MDTATLVDGQIAEGQQLIDHLRGNGIEVHAAVWVLTSAEGLWFLYIASPVVETAGQIDAYRRVFGELSRCPVQWISRSDIRLIGSQNPIALDAIAYQRNGLPTRFGGRTLGKMIIEKAYIYPKGSVAAPPSAKDNSHAV